MRSHRFPGANTALPFVNRDPVQLKVVQDFLRDGQISVDVFGITAARREHRAESARRARVAAGPQICEHVRGRRGIGVVSAPRPSPSRPPAEVLAPLDKIQATVRRGESVRVEVVVRTRKVGHFFPGGTVDAFDVWVELEAVDDKGRVLLHSGAVADGGKGPVEPGAHFYRSLQLDEHGNPINKRNAWMTRSVAYVRLIPPGAADTVHYRLQMPKDAGRQIFLRAKVNYRKFAWWNTQWAFAGVRDPADANPAVDAAPTTMASGCSPATRRRCPGRSRRFPTSRRPSWRKPTASLAVDRRAMRRCRTSSRCMDPSVRERWNDYGIGLLLQGDLKAAQAAFTKVMAMDPAYADGPVNVARARSRKATSTPRSRCSSRR